MDLEVILHSTFGFSTFRDGQKEAIEAALQGERVLLIQPTGWGKSLVYQMIAVIRGLTLVFSPLRALMRDQVRQASRRYNIQADTVNCDMEKAEQIEVLERAKKGELQLLFVAPERLENEIWTQYVQHLPIQALVIDEAHCISVWGHDFRPHYRRIVNVVQLLPPRVPVLAVTATAPLRVQQDIQKQMGGELRVIRGMLHRPNLELRVQPVSGEHEKRLWVLHLLQNFPGTGLIYCATRSNTEMISEFLAQAGIDAPYYHAGLDEERRRSLEKAFMENRLKALVGTNALGMGIDKEDVRFVIHTEFPASVLHYYQEIGRAGRDGKQAHAVLLFDPEDRCIQEYFIRTSRPPQEDYENLLHLLCNTALREKEIILALDYTQNQVRTMLHDLLDQDLVVRDSEGYYRAKGSGTVDFSQYAFLYEAKCQELETMMAYAKARECRMVYLRRHLDDPSAEPCGICDFCSGLQLPSFSPDFQKQWGDFIFHPPLDCDAQYKKQPIFRQGLALAYFSGTDVGQAVHQSKYETGEPFPEWLVEKSAEVISKELPLETIQALTPVPSTKSGDLVTDFTKRLARRLGKAYAPLVKKVRQTEPQKKFVSKIQKRHNLKDAFALESSLASFLFRSLLIVDDVFDSGVTLEEVGKVLKKEGVVELYAFCLTRTQHRGDV